MTDGLAPIVLFAFRRPLHTQQVLDSLAANAEAANSTLHVYCDGAKAGATADDMTDIAEVRRIVRSERRFGRTVINERSTNAGLANSIISGVSEVAERYGEVIVVEDDLILSHYFLRYMNDSLRRYRNDPRVGQIGACNFFACGPRYPRSFFIPIPDCWGWATWNDRWRHFEPDASLLLTRLKQSNLLRRFNVEDAYPMEHMLQSQVDHRVDSWAIRWQAICVLNDWWTLYPNQSMSNHVESLKNTHATANILPPLETEPLTYHTVTVSEEPSIMRAMKRGYAGVSHFDGTPNYLAARAWLRYLAPQRALSQWRALRTRLLS